MSFQLSAILMTILFQYNGFVFAETSKVIPFNSKEGILRFERSEAKIDFFALANQFESQSNKTFCGVASATIVLNALKMAEPMETKPLDKAAVTSTEYSEWEKDFGKPIVFNRYTQGNFFNVKTDLVKSRAEVLGLKQKNGIRDGGLTLIQLQNLLMTYDLEVKLKYVDEIKDSQKIKYELIKNLQTPDDYIIANFFRPVLEQKGGGHISPIVSYDKTSDSFLLLDVNPNGQSWVWVEAMTLILSMNTKDGKNYRGYLLVSRKEL